MMNSSRLYKIARVEARKGTRCVAHVLPKFTKKVTYSAIPVTLYNIGFEHHQLSLEEVQKILYDSTITEAISAVCKILIHVK